MVIQVAVVRPMAVMAVSSEGGNTMNKSIFSLLLPALLAVPILGARAQTGAEPKPVTLTISEVPVQTALKLLFSSAGIRNFVIDPDVQGAGNVGALSLSGVPLSVALKQVLGAVNPPLTADLRDGIYHVHTGASVLPDADTPTQFSASATDTGQNGFYKIGIKHYDAGMIADALTRRGGIILLPPNFVIPSAFSASGAPAGTTITTVGAPRNPAPAAPAVNNAQAGALGAANALPPGVKRIFILESDNSLVIEATPKGYDNLTGESLLSGGYTQVY